jgi:hypothetical protein
MATAEEIVQLLGKYLNKDYFVVDVKAAMRELKNPLQDFEQVLSDQSLPEWHFYALEGLRSIAGQQKLSQNDSRIIIEGTNRVAQQFGSDEFYKSFDAFARSPDNTPYLRDFVMDLLRSRNQRDWLWLAFCAMATLLHRRHDLATGAVAQQLIDAYREAPPSRRRPQMEEIVKAISGRTAA